MIAPSHARLMARYNRWQNESIYGCAEQLTDAERRRDAGAFFGSIHATLNHLVWGDRIWLHRFSGSAQPPGGIKESVALHDAWADPRADRQALDTAIIGWTEALAQDWLDSDLTY